MDMEPLMGSAFTQLCLNDIPPLHQTPSQTEEIYEMVEERSTVVRRRFIHVKRMVRGTQAYTVIEPVNDITP